jgi:hypothetical protein
MRNVLLFLALSLFALGCGPTRDRGDDDDDDAGSIDGVFYEVNSDSTGDLDYYGAYLLLPHESSPLGCDAITEPYENDFWTDDFVYTRSVVYKGELIPSWETTFVSIDSIDATNFEGSECDTDSEEMRCHGTEAYRFPDDVGEPVSVFPLELTISSYSATKVTGSIAYDPSWNGWEGGMDSEEFSVHNCGAYEFDE